MRIFEIASPITYYHGSKKKFPVGFVLTPQSDGYVHGVYGDESDKLIRKTESILEKYRPTNMIPRKESVFLVDSMSSIEYAGGYTDNIYMVAPDGVCERANLYWYGKIESSIIANDKSKLKFFKEWATNYWNAVSAPSEERATYEYRCRRAAIIKIIRS